MSEASFCLHMDNKKTTKLELYRGTNPIVILKFMQSVMICRSHINISYEMLDSEAKEVNDDLSDLISKMNKTNEDNVTHQIAEPLRVQVVSDEEIGRDEYVDCNSDISYHNEMWHLKLSKSKLPPGTTSGLYRCAFQIDAKQGFWNRDPKIRANINIFMFVQSKLNLIIMERTGDIKKPKEKDMTLCQLMKFLVNDFRQTFLLE